MLSDSYVNVIDVLGLSFDMLSMEFHTTRHWQTSGRLVQELDVCTVVETFFTKEQKLTTDKHVCIPIKI